MATQKSKRREYSDMGRMGDEIISRANYSLAILGMSFVYGGSGEFLNLRGIQRPMSGYLGRRQFRD